MPKESGLLQFNNIQWRVSSLAEKVILLECNKNVPIEGVHSSSHFIERLLGKKLVDIVPAYHSIAIFSSLSIENLVGLLEGRIGEEESSAEPIEIMDLPICYEMGMDLDRICEHTSLKKEEVISHHLKAVYRSLFIGFTPGFIYSDGLDDRLACPRLGTPRKYIPYGSVGIAGNQTGIYSLDSPGGWNIIGRTPTRIFDAEKLPPMLIGVGSKYRFYRISVEEFESWES